MRICNICNENPVKVYSEKFQSLSCESCIVSTLAGSIAEGYVSAFREMTADEDTTI